MYSKKLISGPMFYISAFFEAHRDEYYERLRAVSRDGDWTGWSEFFLKGVKIQAEENLRKTNAILALYNQMKPKFAELTRSQYAIHALDWIFDRPIFKSSDFVRNAGIPDPTAKRILGVLKNDNVLKTLHEGSGRRAAVLSFPVLLNIAEGHKVF